MRIVRYSDESIDHLIKRFKRSVAKEGIIYECRRRTAFIKPGERQRKKHAVGISRARKAEKNREYLANRAEKRQAYLISRRYI